MQVAKTIISLPVAAFALLICSLPVTAVLFALDPTVRESVRQWWLQYSPSLLTTAHQMGTIAIQTLGLIVGILMAIVIGWFLFRR